MILLALACLLGGVPVAGDCGAAQRYAPTVPSLPPEHWAQVARVEIVDQRQPYYWPDTRTIQLPIAVSGHSLAHETAHAWHFSDRQVLDDWLATFWPGDHWRPLLPPYAAARLQLGVSTREAAGEDLAETYAFVVCDRPSDPARRAWLYQRAPSLASLPRANCGP